MPRGSKALLIWPEFGPLPQALSFLFSFFFKIYFILFFLACACVLGRNVKRNHCLALTRPDSLSGCREDSSFDRYLCNILDGPHNRLALAAERKPSPAHIRLARARESKNIQHFTCWEEAICSFFFAWSHSLHRLRH